MGKQGKDADGAPPLNESKAMAEVVNEGMPKNQPAAARNLIPPFPFPSGKAGAGGFPPRRAKNARLPPQEGSAPL